MMTKEEAREIIIKERDSLKANPMVKVEDCLYEAFDMAIKALEQARPKGKWIDDSKEDSYYANCSHCNYQIDTHYERGYLNYCPNCGAKMEVSE